MGAAYPSRIQCGGNRKSRRKRQRVNWEHLRDVRTVLRTLARLLNLLQGGSDPRETIGKLQILWNFSDSNVAEGNTNLLVKDSLLYVGLESPMRRVECENGKEKNKEENDLGEKWEKKIKSRRIEDGLLLVVFARIYD